MGYEVAGGLGVKMARPDHEVIVIVKDGSYPIINELATRSCSTGISIVVVTDNFGYACITRLAKACGGRPSTTCRRPRPRPTAFKIDFAANARLGAAPKR